MRKEIRIRDTIKLDQFLKLTGVISTGGQAKLIIQDGQVKVNSVVETRRGKQINFGDRIEVEGSGLFIAVE